MFKLLHQIPQKFILACSGGVDSMVALNFLSNGRKEFKVLHINHGTKHAAVAEEFVSAYCAGYDLELEVVKLDCEKKPGDSQEAVWHDARSKIFQSQPHPVITAHHLNDAIEWWIFTALRGNPCLMPDNNENILRPFLGCYKSDIMGWKDKYLLPWIEDPSNYELKYSRNIIRHKMMSAALEVNPGLERMIQNKLFERAGHERIQKLAQLEEDAGGFPGVTVALVARSKSRAANQMNKEEEKDWVHRMVELEKERGEFPPGGFGGGVVASHRRKTETVTVNKDQLVTALKKLDAYERQYEEAMADANCMCSISFNGGESSSTTCNAHERLKNRESVLKQFELE